MVPEMPRRLRRLASAAASLLLLSAPARAQGWELVWGDEFEGARGAAADARRWAEETGGEGWGKKGLQSYTKGGRNAYLEGQG